MISTVKLSDFLNLSHPEMPKVLMAKTVKPPEPASGPNLSNSAQSGTPLSANKKKNIFPCTQQGCGEKLTSETYRIHHELSIHGVAPPPDPMTKDPNTNRYTCGVNGCDRVFGHPKAVLEHRDEEKAKQHHDNLLLVYLSHYLVFKTDIVISVNAIIPTANLT
jgi:hypothetical protein